MSKTAKIIIVLAVLAVAAAVYFMIRKRNEKVQPKELTDEEKKQVGRTIENAAKLGIIQNVVKK